MVLALGTAACGDGGDTVVDLGLDNGGGGDADVSDADTVMDMGEDADGLDVGSEDAGGQDAGPDPDAGPVPELDELDDMTTDEDEPAMLTLDLTNVDVGNALLLSVSSSDLSVLTNDGISVSGTGVERTVVFTPVANASGATTITVTAVVDGVTLEETFVLTVNPVNDAPTLTSVPGDQNMLEDGASRQLNVGIADIETSAESLTLTAVSSMPSVLGVTVSSEGSTRTVTLHPQANRFGTVTVSLSLSDGDPSATATFDVTLDPVNDAPVLSTAETLPVEVNEDPGTITIPIDAIDVDIDGVFPPQVPAQTLSFSSTRTNNHPGLVTDVSVAGGSVVITIADDLSGEETITLTVSDDGTPPLDAQIVLPIRVLSAPDAPTLEQLATVTVDEDSGITNVMFDVADVDSQNIAVGAAASNPGLFQDLSVSEWEGGNRTVTLSLHPAPDAHGTSLVTITATDGITATEMTFTVNVTNVNDAPTIVLNSPDPQTINMNTTSGPISFTVTDIDNPPCSLVLTSTTTDVTRFPTRTFQPGCTAMGNSATRTFTVTPGAGQTGAGDVFIRATDAGGLSAAFMVRIIINPPA